MSAFFMLIGAFTTFFLLSVFCLVRWVEASAGYVSADARRGAKAVSVVVAAFLTAAVAWGVGV